MSFQGALINEWSLSAVMLCEKCTANCLQSQHISTSEHIFTAAFHLVIFLSGILAGDPRPDVVMIPYRIRRRYKNRRQQTTGICTWRHWRSDLHTSRNDVF